MTLPPMAIDLSDLGIDAGLPEASLVLSEDRGHNLQLTGGEFVLGGHAAL